VVASFFSFKGRQHLNGMSGNCSDFFIDYSSFRKESCEFRGIIFFADFCLTMNTLYFADCLDVLQEPDREHDGRGFTDLIYIDPPSTAKEITTSSLKALTLKILLHRSRHSPIPGFIPYLAAQRR
jgi:hypothetical protein